MIAKDSVVRIIRFGIKKKRDVSVALSDYQ